MDKKTPEGKKKAAPKKPAFFLVIDHRNLSGWIISCFIICGCMFFLGVMVGRNTLPVQFDVNRLGEKLSDLQDSVLKQKKTEKEAAKPATTELTAAAEFPMVFEDIIDTLKDKGKDPEIYKQYVPPLLKPKYAKTPPPKNLPVAARTSADPEPQKQAPPTPPAAAPEPVAILKPEFQAAPEAVSEPVVTPVSMATEKPVPAEKFDISVPSESRSAGPGFAIQVASLKDPEKAALLMNKFKEKGYPAFCQSSEVSGALWHRVRIGPYPDRALADRDQDRLKAAGVDSLIISID